MKKTRWAWWLGTFFGAGYMKPGPGTYGSVAAVLLWWGGFHLLQPAAMTWTLITLAATVVVTALGIPASTIVARESGRKDPGFVVVDEVVGQWVASMLLLPTFVHVVLSLLLFRLFDIFKPWPIRKFEALPEGTGIMVDDLVAGVFALVSAHILLHFVPALR